MRSPNHRRLGALVRTTIALLLLSAAALGEPGTPAPPANSVPREYGSGWTCARGFHEVNAACIAVKVPGNAYLDTSGHDWQCNRGYRRGATTCTAIKLPPNAYADDSSYGRGWRCERGFRDSNEPWCGMRGGARARQRLHR